MNSKMISRSTAIAALYDVINNDIDSSTIDSLIEATSLLILEVAGIDAWGMPIEDFRALSSKDNLPGTIKLRNERKLGLAPLCEDDRKLLAMIG